MEKATQKEPYFDEISQQDAIELKRLLSKFVASYTHKSSTETDQEWLKAQFIEELPELGEKKAEQMAQDAVNAIQEYDQNLTDLNDAAREGTSKEQWLANRIAEAATGVSIIQYGEYLNRINTALTNANAQMMRTITTNSGEISQCLNLDGFIAEQHHVNSFNANAALAKSKFFAEVKVPQAGEVYGKNSFDIVIRDSTNPKAVAVHQYQVKYGADAQSTIQLLREHGEVTKYSNQQILVPPEQVEAVQRAFPGKHVVDRLGNTQTVDIQSQPLTKSQAKEIQIQAQSEGVVPAADWNAFQTKELAIQIGKNAGIVGLQAVAITTGFSIAEQIIRGNGINVDKTVALALKTGSDAGIKTAVTGAVQVGIQKGIIRFIPQGTPIGIIANLVCVGIENIKILWKVASGDLTMSQAIEQMGRTTTAMVLGIGWGIAGAGIGAAALAWIPVIGPIIGGIAGGMIGYMAGSKVGEAIYDGLAAVKKSVVNTCKAGWNTLKRVLVKNPFKVSFSY